MKNVTVLGMYIKKDEPISDSFGGTAYGNLLSYPGVLSRKMLEAEGFRFH